MARNSRSWQLTHRDIECLRVLQQLPLSPSLLLKWSEQFELPFPNIDVVHRRLAILRETAGLVHRWPLAIAGQGRSEHYYKLTLKGYRVLHEDQTLTAPTSRAFSPISEAHHRHSMGVSQLIVHLATAAHRLGILCGYLGENRYGITVRGKPLWTDGYLRFGEGLLQRSYLVEIDNSTETILSARDTDSIERKIRLIEAHQSQYEGNDHRRSITLFVTLRSRQRSQNILAAVRKLSRNPNRRNFHAAYLPDCLDCAEPLTAPCFQDHHNSPVSLLPADGRQQAGVAPDLVGHVARVNLS